MPKLDQDPDGSKIVDLFGIILEDHGELLESMRNFSKLS